MRYERKYRISGHDFHQVRQNILLNPIGFHKSYPDRWINSLYFDHLDFKSWSENLDGISERTKWRIRWYGKDLEDVTKPRLEEKIRNNALGTKRHSKIEMLDLQDISISPQIKDLMERKMVQPVVIVRYLRSYFESHNRKVRATIDRNLTYYPIHSNKVVMSCINDEAIILEIKYDQEEDHYIDQCLQYIPYRWGKNSKFQHAMNSFWS